MNGINLDSSGLMYKWESDGTMGYGDSCAFTMRLWHLKYIRYILRIDQDHNLEEFKKIYKNFIFYKYDEKRAKTSSYGIRAPEKLLPKAWGDPIKDFSADQHHPLLYALGAYFMKDVAFKLYMEHKARHWFYQNGDWPRIFDVNIYNRIFNTQPVEFYDKAIWPIVYARCGYLPFYDSGIKKWLWGDPKDVSDDQNLIHFFLQCETTKHTTASKKAMNYYIKKRIEPSVKMKNKILSAIATFHEKDNPGMIDLYAPVVERLFV